MSTLVLIPARFGSKRVPFKNRAVVNGRTLVERAIFAAVGAKVNEIVVSTDDSEILTLAQERHVFAIDRPRELALDDTPMAPVARHALDVMEAKLHDHYEYLVILEPPATFRRSSDIDFVLDQLKARPDATGIRTITRMTDHFAPHLHRIAIEGYMDPLDAEVYGLPPETYFRDNGLVNIIRVAQFRETGKLFDYRTIGIEIHDAGRGLDIDTPHDLEIAQQVAGVLDRN